MRTCRLGVIAVLSAAACLAACSGDQVAGPATGKMPESVTDSMSKVLAQYDPGALSSMLADNAKIMPPNVPAIEGRDAILDYYKGAVTPELHWELTAGKSLTIGGVGLAEGAYRIKNEKSGEYIESGKYLSVWANQDGQWKLVRLMDSPDHQVAQGSVEVSEHPAEAPKP